MLRRMFTIAFTMMLGVAMTVQAVEPRAKPAKDDLALKKRIDRQKFLALQQSLLRLAQRLQTSTKADDRARAANIRKALELASKAGIDDRFHRLIVILQDSKDLSVNDIQEAMQHNRMLVADIRAILELLLSNDRADKLRNEITALKDAIKRLDRIIRDEKMIRAGTEGNGDIDDIKDKEARNRERTQDVARALGGPAKKGDPSSSPPNGTKPNGNKPNGNKPNGNKPATPGSDAEPDTKLPADAYPARAKIQDAEQHQKDAENRIADKNRDGAANAQSKAINDLEKARKMLEELLRQRREEEVERTLAALAARCQKMLQMQLAVQEGTVAVDASFQKNPDKDADANRRNIQKSIDLSKKETAIVDEANKAIQLLESEGSTVAFPEVFKQLRDDMRHVERRLGRADVGVVTQTIEADIIATLREMVAALELAQQQAKNASGASGESNPSPMKNNEQQLVKTVAELKLIRSLQVRVNNRTKTYAKTYEGEQASNPEIVKELDNLAGRQQRIYKTTDDIARGKNR